MRLPRPGTTGVQAAGGGAAVMYDAAAGRWLHFLRPRRIIETRRIDEVLAALRAVEEAVAANGLYAAGFLAYEAAPAFDEALAVRGQESFPLLWFGIYDRPEARGIPASPAPLTLSTPQWSPSVSRREYDLAISRIKDRIARGETYQVNYTFRLRAPFRGEAWRLFLELVRAQRTDYGAYVDTGRYAVCSASPELFFRLDGRRIVSRPMKGTAPRGRTLAEDNGRARWLRRSLKNRAENVMILDMVRNDMGRIAPAGCVRVEGMFEVEKYPTVWQMTSTAAAATDASLSEVMAALFPCASVTGAPKPRTMRIISELETAPRGVYTGCVGFIAPGRRAQFNVAIRTALVDREARRAEYGVGGGIMWDSESGDEYDECLTKALALTKPRPDFSLLETMLWIPQGGYFLLEYHMERLRDSASYFDFEADEALVRKRLEEFALSLPPRPHRVRLLVSRDGAVSCEAGEITCAPLGRPLRLGVARRPVDSRDPFLYHKTTNRGVYEAARAFAAGCDDVVLWNERGEVTESTIANIVVEREGVLVTPPVRCGLLPGTFRAWLLERAAVREEVVPLDELGRSGRMFLVNSVRGWMRAELAR